MSGLELWWLRLDSDFLIVIGFWKGEIWVEEKTFVGGESDEKLVV